MESQQVTNRKLFIMPFKDFLKNQFIYTIHILEWRQPGLKYPCIVHDNIHAEKSEKILE